MAAGPGIASNEPPLPRSTLWRGRRREGEEHAVEIDAHDAAPFLVVHLQDRALAAARDAGVGDTVVDVAHHLQRLGEARLDLRLVADIQDLGVDLSAGA